MNYRLLWLNTVATWPAKLYQLQSTGQIYDIKSKYSDSK